MRQRWPEAEAALQIEDEILITRDSRPVAKLVRVGTEGRKRSRWDPEEHARWQRKVSGGKLSRSDAAGGRPRRARTHAPFQMIFLDTSCLLKLLREEPESVAVRSTVDAEEEVVVSSLTELETEVQLKAAALGGDIRASQSRQYQVS